MIYVKKPKSFNAIIYARNTLGLLKINRMVERKLTISRAINIVSLVLEQSRFFKVTQQSKNVALRKKLPIVVNKT